MIASNPIKIFVSNINLINILVSIATSGPRLSDYKILNWRPINTNLFFSENVFTNIFLLTTERIKSIKPILIINDLPSNPNLNDKSFLQKFLWF